ncbi:hypothetical protein vseg_017542 [Gypsophila vaccaria]
MDRKVETLPSHSTTLAAQLSLLQRNASCLSVENNALKERLKYLEQQTKLKNDLKEALKKENDRLKMETQKIIHKNCTSDTRL